MTVLTAVLVVAGALAVVDVLLASSAGARIGGRTPSGHVRGPLAWSFAAVVRAYRAAAAGRYAGTCRYEPSCSTYALVALRRHGGVRGGALAAWRLLRCNPLWPGGYDPVPARDRIRPHSRHNHGETHPAPAGSRVTTDSAVPAGHAVPADCAGSVDRAMPAASAGSRS